MDVPRRPTQHSTFPTWKNRGILCILPAERLHACRPLTDLRRCGMLPSMALRHIFRCGAVAAALVLALGSLTVTGVEGDSHPRNVGVPVPGVARQAGTPQAGARVERFEIPATDEGLPGTGPIRRYDWLRELWRERRSAWDAQREQ